MKICLLGVDFFSDNRGCAALGYSAVNILKNVCDEKGEVLELYAIVFNVEERALPLDGIKYTLKKISPKSVSYWKECMQIFKKCDLIIDFTWGDSFSDLYGFKRFIIASALKRIAISSKTPFMFGPQTIGPFNRKITEKIGAGLLKKADYCFVRDAISGEVVKKIAGRDAVLSTDVAFSLPTVKRRDISTRRNIGINPSGLLWYATDSFDVDKYVSVDYKKYVYELIEYLMQSGDYNVYLIPHVFSLEKVDNKDDLRACMEIREKFPDAVIISDFDTPMEAKGYISQMDIFIGARMHATIAAFSTGVTTIPFSYSRKFEGLYHDLGYKYLISGTAMSTDKALALTKEWISNPELLREEMNKSTSEIKTREQIFVDTLRKLVDEIKAK